MVEHLEVERTYAPHPGTDLPDLASLPGVAEVGVPSTDQLVAVYFDTADFALTRAGVSLRRRTGGTDAGWHLKVPSRVGRDEVRVPLSRAMHHPPAVLRRYVVAWVRDAAMTPIATVSTTRTTRQLLGADGAALAELADDEVSGTPARTTGGPVLWREWELELAAAGPSLLDAADHLMAGIGVEPSKVQRKLLHVLGDQVPAAPAPLPVGPDLPAGRVLHRRLVEQVDELKRRDSQIRRGRDDGVHRGRVACRRLRAALATYRTLMDRSVIDPIRDEIRWLGLSLSDARDAKVVHDRLRSMLAGEPPAAVARGVGVTLDRAYAERRRAAWSVIDETLSSDRYLALLDALDRLVVDPPWTERASKPAEQVLPRLLRKDWRRLERAMAHAEEAEELDTALHDVRKDAKRLMYAAETLEPVWGEKAVRLADATHRLTAHLGERQDIVMTGPALLEIVSAAHSAGDGSPIWDRLATRGDQRRTVLDEQTRGLWESVSRQKLRRWLD